MTADRREVNDSLQPNVLAAGAPAGISYKFWLAALATGIAAGLAGGLLMRLLQVVQHLAWHYQSGEMLDAAQHSSPAWRLGVLVVAGVIAGSVRFFAQTSGGGHAGEVAEAIWFKCGEMPVLKTMVKAILSVVIVGMGASLGREAAAKQTGSLFGVLFARLASLPSAERRLLAACGTGAGLAAVYNVPLGGALFSLEVLLGSLSLPLVPPALLTSLLATWISWLLLANQPTYHVPAYGFHGIQIVWALIAGPIIGIAATFYIRLISWADHVKPSRWLLLVMPVVAFAALGTAAIWYPQLLGNGKDVVQRAFTGQLALPVLIPLLLLKPAATSGCLASGAPGGLFTPTACCGALLGAGLGWICTTMDPSSQIGAYAVVGAGAFLAAAMQAPITAFVLILELTYGGQSLAVPLMLATASASVITRRLDGRSIYSGRIHEGISAEPKTGLAQTPLGAIETGQFDTISSAARYPETLKKSILAGLNGVALYVIDEKGRLVGNIQRDFAESFRPTSLQLSIGTARDFAAPSAFVTPDMPADEIDRMRKASSESQLPAVDAKSGCLIGAVMSNP